MAAPYNPPIKGEDFVLRVSLSDMAMPGTFKANPSLAAGDFKIDKDGYGLAPLSIAPVVQPAGSVLVRVTLTPDEMAADVVTIVGIDQSFPKEWADFVLSIPTTAMASTVHVASAIYLNDEMALQPPFEDSAIGGGTIQALPPAAGAASSVARDASAREGMTVAPIHMVSGGEMALGVPGAATPTYSLRMTNVGGGFSAGAVDSNMVSFWLDDNWINSDAQPAPLDASVPSLILQTGYFLGLANTVEFINDWDEFDRYFSFGWSDAKDQLQLSVGFDKNWVTSEPGVQPDMAFCAQVSPTDGHSVPHWKFAFSNGNHFVPNADNVVDVGDAAHRVRDIHAGSTVHTPLVKLKQAGLLDNGSVVSERVDRPDIPAAAVLSNTDMTFEDFGYPDIRFRTVNLGTADPWMLGDNPPVDTNGIYFYASDNYGSTTPPDPTSSNLVAYLYPYTPGYAGILGLYACEAAFYDYTNNWDATIGWDNQEAPTRFNIRVGFWSGTVTASQADLAFCADDSQPKWTMAFSNGNHLIPGTDNLQDIGDPTHRVRAVHAGSLGVENFTSDKVVLPPPAGYESVGSETLYNAFGYVGLINPNYTSGLWLDGFGNNLDDLTLPGEAMIISGGVGGWLIGAQAWGQGEFAGKPLYVTANWGFGAWHEPHITPWRDNVSDLGSHTNRLRDVHAGTSVSTPRLLLSDTGGTTSERGDTWRGGTIQVRQSDPGAPEGPEGTAPPLHMMSGGVIINGTEGFKWRQMSIGGGGGGEFGGSGSDEQEDGLDANVIMFFVDDDSTIESQPNGGRLIQMMASVGSYFYDHFHMFSSGPLSDYESSYGGLAWSEDKSFFQLAVASYGTPKDLAFCTNTDTPVWRVSHSTGGHFIPEVDNTLDIGSPEKRLRRVHAASLMGNVSFRDDTTGAPHWSILHSQGSHLTPEVSNTYDIGTEAYRVRTAYINRVTTPHVLLESKPGNGGLITEGGITAKGTDQPTPSAVIGSVDWDGDALPLMRYRQLSIGGNIGGAVAANYITFCASVEYSDSSEDLGKIVMGIMPGGVTVYGAKLGMYNNDAVPTGVAGFGWDSTDVPTRFNIEVGQLNGGVQTDLAFTVEGGGIKWRMAHSTGSHLVPETDNTLDIGALSKSLRSLFTSSVQMPVSTPAAPTDGLIWFDGTALKMQVGGVAKTFAFAP